MNELNFWSYFASTIYQLSRPEFVKDLDKICDEYILEQKKIRPIDELYPVYLTAPFQDDPRVEEFCKFLGSTAWTILNTQGYNMDVYDVYIQDLWCQEHYKHSGHDIHTHGFGSQLSGFYYLSVPPNSSKAMIHDPRAVKTYADLPERNDRESTAATKMYHFDPEVGSFMFFNSWLPHSFTKHGNKKPFRFLHFNIGVVYKGENLNNVNKASGPIIV